MSLRLPLAFPCVGLCLGVASVRADIVAIDVLPFVLLMACLACLPLFAQRLRLAALFMLLGMSVAALSLWQDARLLRVPAVWLQQPMLMDMSIEKVQARTWGVRLQVSHMRDAEGRVSSAKAWLYVRAPAWQWQQWAAGQSLQAVVRWKRPRNSGNPQSFDWQAYCFDHHIALTGSVRANLKVWGKPSLMGVVRQRIRIAFGHDASNADAVLRALVLADRQGLSESQQQAFAMHGVAHLLAISGLHIAMVLFAVAFLCRWLLTRRLSWIVRWPVHRISLLVGLCAAMLYAALAGWPLPTQRAVLLAAAVVLAWCWQTRHAALNILLAALMLIVLFDPAAVTSLSLWLSFVAAMGLAAWASTLKQQKTWASKLLALWWVSLLSWLLTLPLIVPVFGSLAPYSLWANSLMLPLYGFWVLPAALLAAIFAAFGSLDLASLLAQFAAMGIAAGMSVLDFLSTLPWAHWRGSLLPVWLGLAYAVLLLLAGFALWRQAHAKAMAWTLLALGMYLAFALPEQASTEDELWVWDVGQGSAATLRFANGSVMQIDAPGSLGSRFNGGVQVAQNLRFLGQKHLDVVLASHAQSDHMGGLLSLIRRMNSVGALWLADTPRNRQSRMLAALLPVLHRRGGHVRWLKQGDILYLAHARFEVLNPKLAAHPSDGNDESLVLRMTTAAGVSVLFAGDMSKRIERQLLRDGMPPSDIALMPHHGSKTASHRAWVQTLRCQHVIAQTGWQNRYHFPAQEVLERYQETACKVWNTADGAVRIGLQKGYPVHQYHARFSEHRAFALRWWGQAL